MEREPPKTQEFPDDPVNVALAQTFPSSEPAAFTPVNRAGRSAPAHCGDQRTAQGGYHAKPSLAGHLARLVEDHPYLTAAAAAAAVFAASAFVNAQLAKKAERENPPTGKFVTVDGVRLHYMERGQGDALVLLHGNGSMSEDFETSGLLDLAARSYRAIAFDRPGYGHSERPRDRVWSPGAQADLLHRALRSLGVDRCVVLGHSWGASAAVALALKQPEFVDGLVLASGYYYPTVRADVVAFSPSAIPIIGDVVRYTISPIASRLLWPLLLRRTFGPEPVPEKFSAFPKEMTFRPSQLKASAEESALMIPDAFAWKHRYRDLKMPVVIIAGDADRQVDFDRQSARLHRDVPHSLLHRISGAGHMVHQTATDRLMSAINEASAARKTN